MKSRSTDEPLSAGPGFNGELHEPATGWQMLGNGYRVYNPVLMRFHSPDNLSPFGKGGLNAFAYGKGDPVNKIDPSGRVTLSRVLGFFSDADGVDSLLEMTAKGMPAQSVIRTLDDLKNIKVVSLYADSRVTALEIKLKKNTSLYKAADRGGDAAAMQEIHIAKSKLINKLDSVEPFSLRASVSVTQATSESQLITSTSQLRFRQASEEIVAHWKKIGNFDALDTFGYASPVPVSAQTAAIRQSGRPRKNVRFDPMIRFY